MKTEQYEDEISPQHLRKQELSHICSYYFKCNRGQRVLKEAITSPCHQVSQVLHLWNTVSRKVTESIIFTAGAGSCC